ncbi:MAG: glycogen-binding domain-containing protein [Bradymonadales bacterium]|nr:glycogen-binding domain-containing protein [Bradymonadales bacterium]
MVAPTRLLAFLTAVLLAAWTNGCATSEPEAPVDTGPADLDAQIPDQPDLTDFDLAPDATCEDECTPEGSRRCFEDTPDMYQVCEIGEDGCRHWSLPRSCPGGQSCSAGVCSSVCQSDPGCLDTDSFRCTDIDSIQRCEERAADCYQFGTAQDCPQYMTCDDIDGCICDNDCSQAGDTRCLTDTQEQICQQTSGGCLVWSTPRTCSGGGACTSGACQDQCVSDPGCTEEGVAACYSLDQVVTCTEVETGCFRWGVPEDCPGSLLCYEGNCEVTCTSDAGCTEAGLIGCWGDGHQRVCQEVETGCFKWGEPIACPQHQACASGTGCGCDDHCTLGDSACIPESDRPLLQECAEDAAGCLYWSYRFCDGGQICDGGECLDLCLSDPGCTAVGITQCYSSNSVRTCLEVEEDCLQWGTPVNCPEHQSCQGTSCQCIQATGCTSADTRRCDDATHYSICQQDDAGCLYWSASTECPPEQTCATETGVCSSSCTSDPGCTAAGLLRCNDLGQVQQCQQVKPGCLKWGTPADCPEHQICSGSAGCLCDDACDAPLAAYCSLSGLLMTCTEDDNGCLYYEPSSCPEDQLCVFDECTVVHSPVVQCGQVQFNVVDRDHTQVFVAGSFNDWSTTALPLTLDQGLWSATESFDLPGVYEYKLIIDGIWVLDPLNPDTTGSGYYTNNLVQVAVIQDCSTSDATRCASGGALEQCTDVSGCLTWLLADPPCTADNTYCAANSCHTITSPVVTETQVTFTVRDKGYTGLDIAGTFTDPAWGVFIPLTSAENHWSATIQRASYPGLTPGDHEYKYRTSTNIWFFDPSNPNTVSDGLGSLNSILTIGCVSECPEPDATRCDSETSYSSCQQADDGCTYWSSPTACASSPQRYCLTDSCLLFPLVDHTAHTVTFYYPYNDQARARVRGTFTDTDWSEEGAVEMSHSGNYWVGVLDTTSLAAGEYWYKYCVNNCADLEWFSDPYNNNCQTTGDHNCPFTVE